MSSVVSTQYMHQCDRQMDRHSTTTYTMLYTVCHMVKMVVESVRDVLDIRFRPFFESGSGQNGTRYRISQPDSARSFLAVS